MQHVQHTFQFCSTSCQITQPPKRNLLLQAMTVREQHAFYFHMIFSVCWTTKSCTRKNRSGAQSGPQKVAREKTNLEHDLEHKKFHAKTPFWSTIWSTKSCTRKHPSGARFGAQKVAREKTVSGAPFGAQKVAREEPPSGARFRAQKVARKKADLEHDLDHKNLHATKPIWSTEDSLEWAAASEELKARHTAGFAQVQDTSGVLFFSSFLHLCN